MTAIRILIFSFLVPREFNFTIGTFMLNSYRLVLICLVPYIIWSLLHKAEKIDWNKCDLFALVISIWPIIAFGLNTNISAALESGGIQALEFSVPYFLVRLCINDYAGRKAFAHTLFLVVAILFFVGIPEALTGRHFIHEIASTISGNIVAPKSEQRLGIWRTFGPMDHPIIYGTICAIALTAALTLARRQKKYLPFVVFAGGGTVMSASSAPLLAFMAQLGMYVWARIFRGYKHKWLLLFSLFMVFYITVDVLSNRDPIRVMFTYLLLNPETGYARYYMWIHSFSAVTQSYWGAFFGYGYDVEVFNFLESSYWRTLLKSTVDSFWLVLMLRFGMTMLVLFGLFLIFVFARSLKHSKALRERKDRYLMQAWFITAFAMTLIATTVHFWSYMPCLYMMVLAVCMGTSPKPRKKIRHIRNHHHANLTAQKMAFQRHHGKQD